MLGFIFQQYNLIPTLNVLENVELPLLYGGVSASERRAAALRALDMVGLSDKYKNRPNQLSGGQQQRVSIARALAGNPGVILADEPTGALDSRTGREVLSFLQKLNAAGHTIVLITHDNSIAVRAQRIIRLQDGRIIYDGNAHDPRAVVQPTESGAKRIRPASERRRGHEFHPVLPPGLKSLATSKMRALLTMLGIIIGVAAVIIIISLGDGMNDMINSEFEKMGTNLLQVQIMGRGSSQNITEEEMYALKDENPDCIAAMSPSVSAMATVKQGSETLSATLTGVGEAYIAVRSLELSQGRFIQYIDTARMQNVCVIGSYVNEETFNGAGLGETLSINGNEYTIVGVLAEQADNTSYGNDNTVYIPYTNATRPQRQCRHQPVHVHRHQRGHQCTGQGGD